MAAEYSVQMRDGQMGYYITADIDEDAVDWSATLAFIIGWANFETEVRLFPKSEVDVVSLEDYDGNSLLPSPSHGLR